MVISLLLIGGAVIGLELLMWVMFRKKLEGLVFPHELDALSLHFFTITRMRVLVLLHSLLLLAVLITSFWTLW